MAKVVSRRLEKNFSLSPSILNADQDIFQQLEIGYQLKVEIVTLERNAGVRIENSVFLLTPVF